LPADPKSAQLLARQLARGELDASRRAALLTEAAKLPNGPIRDLFEGFLPEVDHPGGRKLGSNPRPKAILAIDGDRTRGERLFWSREIVCGSCHRIGNRGTPVGPDLSTIGKLRSREELLDSLLAPSRRVEPKYAAYAVATTAGQSFIGLLIRRDENQVVLRDGQGKEVSLAAKDVENLRPSLVSLMPDGQLANLTAQEAADLIDFLASLR
jgi:putative heme-binding domain-containing protein